MSEDELLVEAADAHVRPATPSFFETFWREAEQRQRRSARRWRAVALACATAAVAAVAAAGVMASSRTPAAAVVDQTWRCTPMRYANGTTLGLHGSVKTPRSDAFFQLSDVQPLNDSGTHLGVAALRFDTSSPTVSWDAHCSRVRLRPSFGTKGLAADNTYTPTFLGGFAGTCRAPADVLIRAHVTFADHHTATAQVAVVTAGAQRPIGYFTWTPRRMSVWLRPRSCDTFPYAY